MQGTRSSGPASPGERERTSDRVRPPQGSLNRGFLSGDPAENEENQENEKSTLVIQAANPAIIQNPRIPAMIAITKNKTVHDNIRVSLVFPKKLTCLNGCL